MIFLNAVKASTILVLLSLISIVTICIYLPSNIFAEKEEILTGRYELKNDAKKKLINLQNTQHSILNVNNCVSIAQLDENYFIIANYLNLLLLNRYNSAVCILKPNGFRNFTTLNSFTELSQVLKSDKLNTTANIYNPTGVFIDSEKSLYVANYKGNNILKGKIKPERCEIEFTHEYLSVNTKGPENIAVDNQLNILVSANYDASTITAHDLGNGQELWSTNVGQAHGVTIAGNKIYATGLTERKIYELNIADGKITNSIGSLGWDPMKSQYLWPTSIYSYDKNTLIISDPQSGFISFVDKKTLGTLRYTGGNGPSYRWLNYPYAALPISTDLIILSSMRGNILFLEKSGSTVKESLIFFKDDWPSEASSSEYFGEGWDGYINEVGPRIRIHNEEYKLGYGHLHPVKNKGPILRIPDINTLFNLDEYMYFLQGAHGKVGVNLFFSSSSGTLIGVVNQPEKPDILLNRKIRLDSWLLKSNLINTEGEITSQLQLAREFQQRADELFYLLSKNHWVSPQEIYEINDFSIKSEKLTYREFIDYFDKVFVSIPGREFKQVYDQCLESECDVKILKQAARNYYFEADGHAYINLDEYLLIGMLSGEYEGETSNSTEITYDDCGRGNYFNGYSVNALRTKALDDYLSAYNINTSYVCFYQNAKRKDLLKDIHFIWYSKEEIPKKIALYGIVKTTDKQHETFIGDYNVSQFDDIQGYPLSIVKLNLQKNFDQYMIKVLEGGKQNRLILRQLEPIFDSNSSLALGELNEAQSIEEQPKCAPQF
ncbi:MAG: hypothetical protein HYX61_08175 [Gammaproteobacteria bacterium]|jgi:hypothetical protein|nr:hypothetical protein [Gammaproteobacteria bacterium]